MKGICFKEPLFIATINGDKTQTRRIMKRQPDYRGARTTNVLFEDYHGVELKPRYNEGEIVYLKEPYYEWDEWDPEDGEISYKFDNPKKLVPYWENKLFMPESAARYFIEITDVGVERLQDILEEDCIKEGISFWGRVDDNSYYTNGLKNKYGSNVLYDTAQEAYAALIDSINGKGTWENNPWVWVYDYVLTEG